MDDVDLDVDVDVDMDVNVFVGLLSLTHFVRNTKALVFEGLV